MAELPSNWVLELQKEGLWFWALSYPHPHAGVSVTRDRAGPFAKGTTVIDGKDYYRYDAGYAQTEKGARRSAALSAGRWIENEEAKAVSVPTYKVVAVPDPVRPSVHYRDMFIAIALTMVLLTACSAVSNYFDWTLF